MRLRDFAVTFFLVKRHLETAHFMTEQNNINLPKSWKSELLGKIAKAEKGIKPKTLIEGKSNNSIPYIDIRAFEKGEIRFYTDGVKCRICEKNDILLVWDGARSGLCGKAIKGAIGSTLAKISSNFLSNEFLFYFLTANYNKLNTTTKGIGIPHIDPNFLWNLKIFVPPLPEQHRIVAKIEELFSELDKAVENLQTARQQLKTYRQSVLKHAFEGKLTATWRESLKFKNESLKLAAEPASVYQTKNGLPEGWEWKTVGDICTKVEYGSSKKSDKEGLVPVLRMGNIQNGLFDWSDLVFSSDSEEIEKYKLKKGDVLFNRTNSPELVGKTAIYLGEQKAIFAGYLIRIHYKNDINPKYLTCYLNSLKAKEFGNSVKTDGVNQSNINGQKLKSYPFPKCTLEEQHQIVAEIEKRFSEADKLEESIETALRQTEALRQSILKKAFAGKLVAQDENKAFE